MGSEKRQFRREKRRMACKFELDGHVCNGFVSDVSARGMFINTASQPIPGSEIEITLSEDCSGEIALRGRIARLRKSHHAAMAIIPSGFGVEIDYAPEAFFELLVEMGLD
jgi:hypothetical protein